MDLCGITGDAASSRSMGEVLSHHHPFPTILPMLKRLLPFIALVALASPAGASIALFVDGRSMKISDYKIVGETNVQLTLKSGGAITVPLPPVDPIVDDERVPPPLLGEVKK